MPPRCTPPFPACSPDPPPPPPPIFPPMHSAGGLQGAARKARTPVLVARLRPPHAVCELSWLFPVAQGAHCAAASRPRAACGRLNARCARCACCSLPLHPPMHGPPSTGSARPRACCPPPPPPFVCQVGDYEASMAVLKGEHTIGEPGVGSAADVPAGSSAPWDNCAHARDTLFDAPSCTRAARPILALAQETECLAMRCSLLFATDRS